MVASNNPIMSRNPYFAHGGSAHMNNSAPSHAFDQYAQTAQQQSYAQYAQPQQSYQQANPSAFTVPETAMTYDDAMVKTFILLGITIISGLVSMFMLPWQMINAVALIGTLAAFAIGMVASFKRQVPAGLALAYAVLEGVALGAVTRAIDSFYPGVAFQAILGTIVVVGVAAGLHFSGAVRTSPRGRRYMIVAMMAAVVFSFINLIVSFFGVGNGFGFLGGPLGIVFGFVMIGVASYVLISDLEDIRTAVENRAPASFAWTCAFGIMVTVIWIYTEVLRILAIFNSDN